MLTRILVQSDTKSEDKAEFLVRLQRPLMDVKKISIISAVIPNTAYTVTEFDDCFDVELDNGSIIYVRIAHGRYTILELLAAIKQGLESHSNNIGVWSITYVKRTYLVTFQNPSTSFRILSNPKNLNDRIGFTNPLKSYHNYTQTSTQSPRMNSSPILCLDLNIPGISMSIPNLGQSYTFFIPFGLDFDSIAILSRTDLSYQTWEINNDGIDLHEIRARLMRTDIPQKIKLYSDVSFVLEIESS